MEDQRINSSTAAEREYFEKCWMWFEIGFWASLVICIIGISLNSISVYIIHQVMRKNSANYMLKLLAAVYNVLLLSLFLTQLLRYLTYKEHLKDGFISVHWSESFRRAVYMFSMYVVVVIASFRSLAIKFPQYAGQIWDKSFLHGCLFAMAVICFATEVPEIVYLVKISTNGGNYERWENNIDLYQLSILCTLSGPIPITIMMICLVHMLIHVRKHHKGTGNSSITSTSLSAFREQMRQVSLVGNVQRMYQCHEITRKFCGIVVVFLMSHTLLLAQMIWHIVSGYTPQTGFHAGDSCFKAHFADYSSILAHLGMFLNASSILIVLAISGTRFNYKLQRIFSFTRTELTNESD